MYTKYSIPTAVHTTLYVVLCEYDTVGSIAMLILLLTWLSIQSPKYPLLSSDVCI